MSGRLLTFRDQAIRKELIFDMRNEGACSVPAVSGDFPEEGGRMLQKLRSDKGAEVAKIAAPSQPR